MQYIKRVVKITDDCNAFITTKSKDLAISKCEYVYQIIDNNYNELINNYLYLRNNDRHYNKYTKKISCYIHIPTCIDVTIKNNIYLYARALEKLIGRMEMM